MSDWQPIETAPKDTKAMTAERLSQMKMLVGVPAMNKNEERQQIILRELFTEIDRLHAVEEKAKVLHEAVAARIKAHYEFITDYDREITKTGKYLEAGTPERAYWHYGYMVALRDVIHQLTSPRPAAPSFLEDGT